MPRTKKAQATQVAGATSETAPAIAPAAEQAPTGEAAQEPRHTAREAATAKPAYAADPHEKISVSLSDVRGGPEMHLLRSHRFRQLQIRFDREQPDEHYQEMLKQAGWPSDQQHGGPGAAPDGRVP